LSFPLPLKRKLASSLLSKRDMHNPATSTQGQPYISSHAPLLAPASPRPLWAERESVSRMAFPRSRLMVPLWIVLGLLVIDAAVEMALVSYMVFYMERGGGKGPFDVFSSFSSTGEFVLFGLPQHLIANQGHTTNGAAGTAVVLVGFGGLIALLLESRSRRKNGRSSRLFFPWVIMTGLSFGLTLAALIFTFIETNKTNNQAIKLSLAATLSPTTPYPIDQWTPENWYKAVLDLQLRNDSDRNTIAKNYHMMVGWRWNLIPMLLLGLAVMALAFAEHRSARRSRGSYAQAPVAPSDYAPRPYSGK